MGMFDFLKKKQSSPAHPSAPAQQPPARANPQQPAQARPTQSPDKANPNKPAQPPVQQPPQKSEEPLVLHKFLFTMSSPADEDACKKFATELCRRANSVWHPHKIWGRVGVHSDNRQKLQIEVQATEKDIGTLIDWCKKCRLYPTYVTKVEPRSLSHLSHTTPQFQWYNGPLH